MLMQKLRLYLDRLAILLNVLFIRAKRKDTILSVTPQYERYLIQIHFFAPLNENVLKRIKETKQALFKACFSFPETTDTSDEDVRHIVFECETTEDLAEYGDDYN